MDGPSTGGAIIKYMGLIYLIGGPLILLGIYTFFDWLAEKPIKPSKSSDKKDPALWNEKDVRRYIKNNK